MTRLGKIIRLNFNKIRYEKWLKYLLTRAIKNPQPEDNILTQTEFSMQAKIKGSEVNYFSNSITMD